MYNASQFNIPGIKFGEEGEQEKYPVLCKCIFIDNIDQLDLMDELIHLTDTDIIGITVTMNADVLNDSYQIDVFGPSLLTLGTVNKIFIIDILKLGQWVEFDDKLT